LEIENIVIRFAVESDITYAEVITNEMAKVMSSFPFKKVKLALNKLLKR